MGFSDKSSIRQNILLARRTMPQNLREAQSRHILHHLVSGLRQSNARHIAAYAPLPTEPGGVHLPQLLARLGISVLLPIHLPGTAGDPAPIGWAPFDAEEGLERSDARFPQPRIAKTRKATLHNVDLVVAPALAVDLSGTRLGRGAGWYDRALRNIQKPVITLLFDGELRQVLPREPHDQPVAAVVTPSGGWRELSLAADSPEC